MRVRGLGGRDHLPVRHLLSAVCDVRPSRIVEQKGLLGHDPDQPSQGSLLDVPEIRSVDLDRALGRIVEPEDQVRERGFPPSAWTHERDHFAHAHREIDTHQHRTVILVREAYMSESDPLPDPRRLHRVRAFRHLGMLIEQREHALRSAQSLLEIPVRVPDTFCRTHHRKQRTQEQQELRGMHRRTGRHDPTAAVPQNPHTDDGREKFAHRPDRGLHHLQPGLHPAIPVVLPREASGLVRLRGERLYDSDTAEGLLNEIRQFCDAFL